MNTSQNDKIFEKLMEAVGNIGCILLVAAFRAVWGGWVLTVLWRWFICPLGLGPIRIAEAAGLVVVAGMFATEEEEPEDNRPFSKRLQWRVICAVFIPLLGLLYGSVIHLFL